MRHCMCAGVDGVCRAVTALVCVAGIMPGHGDCP